MPKYQIDYDGRKFSVESATPLSQEEVANFVSGSNGKSAAPVTPAPEQKAAAKPERSGSLFKDVARNVVGQGVLAGFGDEAEAGLRTGFGLAGDYKGTRDKIRQENAAYEEAHPIASTVGEIGGTLATLPFTGGAGALAKGTALGAKAAGAIGKAGTAGKYALAGAGQGALTGAGKANELEDVAEDAATGGVVGGALGGLGGLVAKGLAAPTASKEVQQLRDLGVKSLTPAQLLHDVPLVGRGLNLFEQGLSSVPISGAMVRSAREGAAQEFSEAAMNKVLKPILKEGEEGVKGAAGKSVRDMVDETYKKIGSKYDEITPKLKLKLEGNFYKQMDQTFLGPDSPVSHLGLQAKTELFNQAQTIVGQHAKNGNLTGEAFRRVEKDLNTAAKSFYNKGEQESGQAMKEVLDQLRTHLELQNPSVGTELKKIHKAFREFLPIEKAASLGGTESGGLITPQRLGSGVKASSGARQFGRGTGQLQDLAETGTKVLGENLPSSGTTERAAVLNAVKDIGRRGGGAAGEGALGVATGGATLLPAAITGLAYNPLAIKGYNALATGKRPEIIARNAKNIGRGAAIFGGREGANMTGGQ